MMEHINNSWFIRTNTDGDQRDSKAITKLYTF